MEMKFPLGPYDVLYADPPWSYRNRRTGGNLSSGSAQKYPVMTIQQITELPIRDIAAADSALFLWATVPLLPEALSVLAAWGFGYKTMLTWRKIMSLGMGFWFRGQTEHLLLGIRGHVRAFRCQRANFLATKALQHSHKPGEFRTLIEVATSQLGTRRIELFATEVTTGWDSWGLKLASPDPSTAWDSHQ